MEQQQILFTLIITVSCVPITYCEDESNNVNVIQQCEYPQEFYDCGSFCQNSCDALGQPCNISTFRCNDKCYCLPKYARDEYNNCIPEWQCPQLKDKKNKCLGENEVLKCGSECQNTCARLGKECPIESKKCKNDCHCKDGYARNSDGVCIQQESCHPGRCEILHEVHFCNYFPCQTNCTNIGKCEINEECIEGCFCERGYVRSREGNCQPEWLCYH